jgi:hypothetical protein
MAQPSMTAVMGVDDQQAQFAQQAYQPPQPYNPAMAMYGQQMAGAPVMAMPPGAAPYPLYGVPHALGTDDSTPVYRRWWFAFASGVVVTVAGSAFLYWKFLRKP